MRQSTFRCLVSFLIGGGVAGLWGHNLWAFSKFAWLLVALGGVPLAGLFVLFFKSFGANRFARFSLHTAVGFFGAAVMLLVLLL